MKKIFTLLITALLLCGHAKTQILLNELYTDPSAGNHEFFELYNVNPSTTPFSVDNLTLVTFFDISGQKGFYVMDLPNMTVASRSYFVGAAALPFNYQGVTGSTAADFSWNSAAFTSNHGYVRKWVQGTANLFDGNLYYDQAALPANFNDFFFRRTGSGSSYTVFLYNNGQLINSFIGGTGGNSTIINDIVNMPPLFVDMTASSPDFTINFSGYASIPVESSTQDAGNDNGYIRQYDGACGTWTKSSASVQHTPRASNGSLMGSTSGSVSVAAVISQGTPATGSVLNNDVVAAPSSYFPIEMQIFTDLGSTPHVLDATDVYVQSNTETVVSDGPFYTRFFPYDANILIAVKTSAGCFDKIIFVPNVIILTVKLISFEGHQNKNDIQLTWEVAANEIADRFEIQKSDNGEDFSTAATVRATEKAGNETYSLSVTAPVSGKSVYRLRIFQKSGKVEYSKNLAFGNREESRQVFAIVSNPVTDKLMVRFQSSDNKTIDFRIVDLSGRLAQQGKINMYKGENMIHIALQGGINRGAYLVDLYDGWNHYADKFIRE